MSSLDTGDNELALGWPFKEEVVSKRCGNCLSECIMNASYSKYVKGDLLSCGKCRGALGGGVIRA